MHFSAKQKVEHMSRTGDHGRTRYCLHRSLPDRTPGSPLRDSPLLQVSDEMCVYDNTVTS